MFSQLGKLESIVDGKVGQFLVNHDASTLVVKEMLNQFIAYIVSIEERAKAQAAQAAPLSADVSEAKVQTQAETAPATE
jgi:hypothetical protein